MARSYTASEAKALRAVGLSATTGPAQYAGGTWWPDELERRADEAERLVPRLRLAGAAIRREIARDPLTADQPAEECAAKFGIGVNGQVMYPPDHPSPPYVCNGPRGHAGNHGHLNDRSEWRGLLTVKPQPSSQECECVMSDWQDGHSYIERRDGRCNRCGRGPTVPVHRVEAAAAPSQSEHADAPVKNDSRHREGCGRRTEYTCGNLSCSCLCHFDWPHGSGGSPHADEAVKPQATEPDVLITINRLRYDVEGGVRDVRQIPFPPIADDEDLWQIGPFVPDVKVTGRVALANGMRFYTSPAQINAGAVKPQEGDTE